MKQMFHGQCTLSQSQTLDFLKFSGGAWTPCLCYLVAGFRIFLHVTLGLVSYCTENFQSVEYCMATSSTTCHTVDVSKYTLT